MTRIKGIILDWAGTTIDFGCMAPVQAFINAFNQSNISVTLAETREPMGISKLEHIQTMLNMPRIHHLFKTIYKRDFTDEDIDKIYILFEKELLRTLNCYTTPKPFVLETIVYLKQKGLRIGSTTGYNQKMMKIIISGAKTAGYEPDYWCCSEHVEGYGRPYPYMIFNNMLALGIPSVNEVLKIGDTQSDIKEGIAAGVQTIGVIEGSSEMGLNEKEWFQLNEEEKMILRQKVRNNFLNYGANYVINNFSELPSLIESLK